jgi:hypothetical protein
MRTGITTALLAFALLFQFSVPGSAFESQKIQQLTAATFLHKATIRNYTPVPASEIAATCSSEDSSKTCQCPGQNCTRTKTDCRCG